MILLKPIKREDLALCKTKFFEDFVKAVVDLETRRLAIDAEYHTDLAKEFEEEGANWENLWGVNLFPAEEEFIEIDSIINAKPGVNRKSYEIENTDVLNSVKEVVGLWIK
ncbi:MAG: DUF5674 family protein [Oscillospiraceae bacterium]|nr:DUF5674 family protein [Oscillospiraceae bacterium]